MRYVEEKKTTTKKIQVPEEFRLPGTDIIVEAGDVIEVEIAEAEDKKDDDDEEDKEDGDKDKDEGEDKN